MPDPLDARIPLLHSGMSIALRDTYTASDSMVVPLEYGGVSCKANALSALPSHARVPMLHGGLTLSPTDIAAVAPYHALAIKTGGTYFQNLALISTDNAFFSMSYWQKIDAVAIAYNWQICTSSSGNGSPGVSLKYPTDAATGRTDYFMSDIGGDNLLDLISPNYNKTVWHHFLFSCDVGHSAASMVGQLYMDDVLNATTRDASGVAFNHSTNGYGFSVLGGSNYWEFADVRIMPGTNLLDGSGTIPVATRRLFIDARGKPVNPATATAALGAPCMLFSGNASTFGINKGTGGAFTVAGTLFDATTSPSD